MATSSRWRCFMMEDGNARGLELQRGVGGIYSRPEGTPPYCVVTADHQTFYGGIERLAWRNTAFDIDFTEDARSSLGLPDSRVSIAMSMSDDDVRRVKDALKRVFAAGEVQYPWPEMVVFD